jgi:hypothetical protein
MGAGYLERGGWLSFSLIKGFNTASVEGFLAPIDIVSTVEGVSTMAECIVAIDRITYYAVQAEDDVTATDLALDGREKEVTSETRDVSVIEDQRE